MRIRTTHEIPFFLSSSDKKWELPIISSKKVWSYVWLCYIQGVKKNTITAHFAF